MKSLILLNILAVIFTRRVLHEERCVDIIKENLLPSYEVMGDNFKTSKYTDPQPKGAQVMKLCHNDYAGWSFKLKWGGNSDYFLSCTVPKPHLFDAPVIECSRNPNKHYFITFDFEIIHNFKGQNRDILRLCYYKCLPN
jgi:hypothetical protein